MLERSTPASNRSTLYTCGARHRTQPERQRRKQHRRPAQSRGGKSHRRSGGIAIQACSCIFFAKLFGRAKTMNCPGLASLASALRLFTAANPLDVVVATRRAGSRWQEITLNEPIGTTATNPQPFPNQTCPTTQKQKPARSSHPIRYHGIKA